MRAKSTPQGYQSITPFITVDDVAEALAFYQTVFDASECIRREMDNKLLLVDVLIGDSHFVISDRANGDGTTEGGADGPNGMTLRV